MISDKYEQYNNCQAKEVCGVFPTVAFTYNLIFILAICGSIFPY